MDTILTTKDVLYLTLAVGFASISIFLSILLLRLSKTVGHINEIAEKIKSITEAMEEYVWQPIHFIQNLVEKIKKNKD